MVRSNNILQNIEADLGREVKVEFDKILLLGKTYSHICVTLA